MLAGMKVPDDDVRELARLVDEPTRSLLEKALGLGMLVLALTIDDRERILWALDDVRTDALAELRATLLQSTRGACGTVWSDPSAGTASAPTWLLHPL